ncbi:MAG: hypothetical protein VR70_16860 [Rhodospirillaceae bacterium BRH_c57]|nr:MAG: hypothetical protein VR70_16860 [Rhodospirillaceae bacterium BRH_c57]
MSADGKPQFIQPPNHVKDKVSVTSNGIDFDTLEKAEQLIAGMQDSYLEWVDEDLRKLQALEAQLDGAGPRLQVFKDIYSISHDVKGQGGSFDYPLMTVIGNHLCRYIERLGDVEPSDKNVGVVKVHISALRLVIAQRMSGDGGKMGDNLIRGLEAAINKTTAAK